MPRGRKPDISVEAAFRSMIRTEIESQLSPLRNAIDELQSRAGDLSDLAHQLSPLTQLLAPFAGEAPARVRDTSGRAGTGTGRRRSRPPGSGTANARACAIRGCGRASRTKGYCSAHYQKLRLLDRTGRRPAAWKDFADAQSVEDVVLPRGRAAHRASGAGKKGRS